MFLDTSVLLAASGSSRGGSREIFNRATENDWKLLTTPYVVEEVQRNLSKLPPSATTDWASLCPKLRFMDDVLTLDRPALFGVAKDRPILFSALAWANVLLTLDQNDFGSLMGTTFYGLLILKPGAFLERCRDLGTLR